jgi:large subunit ribosomal protein L17
MKHGRKLLKLSRSSKSRKHLFRQLTTFLIQHERIRTTSAKARATRRFADRIITLAKKTNITPERKRILLQARLSSNVAVDKVLNELMPRFGDQAGNYSYIRPDGWRKGDGAQMSILQYKGNPYEQYEKELELANPSAKLPEFTYKILKQEEQLFSGKLLDAQNRLEAAKMQEITPSLAKTTPQAKKELEKNVKFFMEKLDRVRRELSFFQENKQVAA